MDDGSPAVSPARRTRKAALMTRGGDVDHRSLLQASLALDAKEREMVGSGPKEVWMWQDVGYWERAEQ